MKTLTRVRVAIGNHQGSLANQVASELDHFVDRLNTVIARLDAAIAPNADLTTDSLNAALEVCAWAHSEWVRIHPLANGNGRIARLLANAIALRYGLPPFVRLRPRPNYGYGHDAEASMRGDHHPLAIAFRSMLNAVLSGNT